jgi:hypothetical protein
MSGDTDAFSCEIEDATGLIIYTKKFASYSNAVSWCCGMIRDLENCAFRVFDTMLNKTLEDGRKLNGQHVPYNNELDLGIATEMEHRDLIISLLPPTLEGPELEAKVIAVATRIAQDHLAEDSHYYSKLKKENL